MSIVDNHRDRPEKNIIVKMADGAEFSISENFSIDTFGPGHGLLRIRDNADEKIYWINPGLLLWIGPR